MNPVFDLEILQQRMNDIENLAKISANDLKMIKNKMKQIYDIDHIANRLNVEYRNFQFWKKLFQSIESLLFVLNFM